MALIILLGISRLYQLMEKSGITGTWNWDAWVQKTPKTFNSNHQSNNYVENNLFYFCFNFSFAHYYDSLIL